MRTTKRVCVACEKTKSVASFPSAKSRLAGESADMCRVCVNAANKAAGRPRAVAAGLPTVESLSAWYREGCPL